MEVDTHPNIEKFRSEDHVVDLLDTNKTQVQSPTNSTPSSGNVQNSPTITVHRSQEELLCEQKNIPLSKSGGIGIIPGDGEDSTQVNPSTRERTDDYLVPVERSYDAILPSRREVRTFSSEIRRKVSTGECSPGEELTMSKNTAKADGYNAGGENSEQFNGAQVTEIGQRQREKVQHMEFLSTTMKAPSEDTLNISNLGIRGSTAQSDNQNLDEIVPLNEDLSPEKGNKGTLECSDNSKRKTASMNLKMISSSHISLNNKDYPQEKGNNFKEADESQSDQVHKEGARNEKQKPVEKNAETGEQHIKAMAAGKSTNPSTSNSKEFNNVMSTMETHVHPNANEQNGIVLATVMQNNGKQSAANTNTNYPKVSNNFTKPNPNTQKNKQQNNHAHPNDSNKQPSLPQLVQNTKKDQIPEPAPYTVVQTYAALLRTNQAKNESPVELSKPKYTTKQGLPAVIFKKEDFMIKLAESCRFTLIGKFTNAMPKVELIRKNFILQTQLTGGVKIAHFNARHVYIDLDNELDYVTVWTKQKMQIEGQTMRIQTWTPTFRPEEETPIVPIWITLPELPWHCYNKEFVTALLHPIGKVLYLDAASIQKTRESVAKVKVQIDLTKERPSHVWMGLDEEDITQGKWQSIQYESIPDYCLYCKHQGHMIHVCTVKKRDDDYKNRKEQEAEKKSKNKGETERQEEQNDSQNKDNINQKETYLQAVAATASTSNVFQHQFQQNQNKNQEEQWLTHRRKNSRNQRVTQQNKVYRPASPQKEMNNNIQQQQVQSDRGQGSGRGG